MKTIRVIIPWIIENKQKSVIIIWIITVTLMGLFPPWYEQVIGTGVKLIRDAGYAFFFMPPSEYESILKRKVDSAQILTSINAIRLWTQIGIVTLISGGFLLLFKEKDK